MARLVSGAGFPIHLQNKQGLPYPFFKVGNLGDVQAGQYLLHSDHTIDAGTARLLRATIVPKDAIVFAKIGMAIRLNRRRLIGVPSCIDNNLMAVLSSGTITPRYLLRFLETIDFMPLSQSTAVPALRKSDLDALKIPLPPLNEQRRIVAKLEDLLSRVNAAQEGLATIPRILKRFRQSVLALACSGRITEKWRVENRSSEWTEVTLSDVITEKPKNGYSARPVKHETRWRVLTLTATTSGRFDERQFKYFDEPIPEGSPLWLQPGDILVQRGNTIEYVGVPALYDGAPNRFIYPDLMMRVRANERIDTKFLYLLLTSEQTRAFLRQKATGTAGNMPKINQSVLMSVPIPLPSLCEQQEIVRRVEALFKTADALEARYLKAKVHVGKLTQSILAKAFSGQLVPQDPNDEPASVLLERIPGEPNGSAVVKRRSRK